MAVRPLAFGLRLRDKGRSVRVRALPGDAIRYLVEDVRSDRDARRREHASLQDALRDAAASWRRRLN